MRDGHLDLRQLLGATLPPPADPVSSRAAAVAAIFRARPHGHEVLFIRRAEREGDPWSGHMALPGGRREPTDQDLLTTAIRETEEEIGLDLVRSAELVGVLGDHDANGRGARASLPTRPFVFELFGEARLTFSEEVSEAFWAPVAPIVRGERSAEKRVVHEGQSYVMPGWDVEGRIVWGLTYWMLSSLFQRLPTR